MVMIPNTIELVFSPKGRPETLTAVGRSAEASRSNSSKRPTGSAAPGSTPAGAGPRPLPVSIRMISYG